jgi:cyclophilin family peptidyl-prolyl cis-trans isomerase/FKBP-type peptidyl-prolyl cis-trans isomerase 2
MNICKVLVLPALLVLLSACTTGQVSTTTNNSTSGTNAWEDLIPNTTTEMPKYKAPAIENWDVVATIKTNNGTIKLKLFTDKVPKTTANFIGLSKNWYYDNVVFHRVIPDFMIQWGDPEGTGRGGESIYWEKFEDEFHPELKNARGTISMANAGPNTNWSQFFINVKDNNFLDNVHSVFGQVVEGMDVADKISKAKTIENDIPASEIKMISSVIEQYQDGKYVEYDFNLDEILENIKAEEAAKKEANKDRVVVETDTVSVHYKGTLEDGSEFDSSYNRGQPIDVDIDAGQVIPGFGNALIGMKIGEVKSVTLAPADAYGEYDETKTQDFPLTDLTAQGITPIAWETVPSMMGELKVINVTEDTVTLDINHALAGKTLNFELELVDFVN